MATGVGVPYVRVVSGSLPDDTQVIELDGREAISELFEFRVMITMPNRTGVDPSDVIGAKIDIIFETLPSAGQVKRELRKVHGLVASCEDMLHMHESRNYVLRVVPRLWKSTLVETLDIQQDISIPDIAKKKLEALHMVDETDFSFRLAGSYGLREFVVQYKESDLAFVSRLCEHIGISYFFEQRDEQEMVVFTDHLGGFESIEGEEIPFVARGERQGVYNLAREAQIVPSNFFERDYNYRNPGADLQAQDSFDGFGGGIVEYGAHFKDADEGKALAVVRRQEQECRQLIYRGEAVTPRICAGMTMKVTDHPYGDVTLLPFLVRHHLKQAALNTGEGKVDGYSCHFDAIDAGLTFRPRRRTPRPRATGMLTGIVDSSGPGDYADVDDSGRYRVRFMFDTSGPAEGKASRPVRMMQPHSGGGYGMHFPLRRGVEVLITFIDGDPDRPIISGTVPNPQTPSPVAASNARNNVLRTGAGNEINIDDTKGSERVKITVPHAATFFQLGAPNLAESGAALQTMGAMTTAAASGTTLMTSFDASLQALTAFRSSGNIVAKAEPPDSAKMMLAGFDMVKAGLAIAAAALATAKAAYDMWEKGALKDGIKEQDKATKIWEECDNCNADAAAMGKELPPPLDNQAQEVSNDAKAVSNSYAEGLDKRRVRDVAREASIGLWTDQNEIAQRRRAEHKQEQYSESQEKTKDARTKANESRKNANITANEMLLFGTESSDDKDKIEAYQAQLAECEQKCAGLKEAQEQADKKLDEYHELRQQNSDDHAWLQRKEKEIGTAAAAMGAATTLVSTIMAIVTFAKKSATQATLGAKWAGSVKCVNLGDSRSNINAKATVPKAPIHSLGSTHSSELFGAWDVLVHAFQVRIYGSGATGEASITGEKQVNVTSPNDVMIAAGDKMFQTGKLIDIYAHNKGKGDGELKLQAWKELLIHSETESIKLHAKAGDKKIRLEAGADGSKPRLTMESNGAGTITAETNEWKLTMDKEGFRAGKPDKGEYELADSKAVFKKKDTKIELTDDLGELTGKKWHLKGDNTEAKISESKITLKAKGRINLETKSKVDVTAKAVVVNGKKIELG